MDDSTELRGQILALRHVVEHLWTNFLLQGADPTADCRHVAEQSLGLLDGMYERMSQPFDDTTLQSALHHEESFWRSVQSRVEASSG